MSETREMSAELFPHPRDIIRLSHYDMVNLDQAGDSEFRFHILKKLESGYRWFASCDTATEAFQLRRKLVKELGDSKLFLRASRVKAPAPVAPVVDEDDAYDAFRDYYSEGLMEDQVPPALREAYGQFLAAKVRTRGAYRAGTRGGVDQWVQ